MIVCWGICLVCSLNDISLNNSYLLYIPYLLGGWSPTIASFISLKKNSKVKNFKDWLRNVFDFKHNIFAYVMVLIFTISYILPLCLVSGYENGKPLFAIVVMIPIMLFGGGLEEAGWRYIFQPELEKKYSYSVSTIIVSVVWWLWHLPLFYVNNGAELGLNYIAYGVNVLGLSFALACIKKNTGSVWLCVLFHSIVNSLTVIYSVNENIWGNIVAAVVLIVFSHIFVKSNAVKRIMY
jgi:membrane protease YdiL (CAAX protease family)